jgi:aminoglycoside phosphotransferase family enzyme
MSAFPEHLQGLLHPRAYPHPVQAVHLVETHISWILLTGEFAYKIKRPVHYPFVDLRSAERREFLCHEEVRLNRRFACELYLGVCHITSIEGEAQLDGPGLVTDRSDVVENLTRQIGALTV